ncbi:MAG: protein kinase [Acidobacteria bacterium]|nr:protein kinase [Acidobacteriota bacterium]
MGEVYRATDTKLGREVALKVLPVAVAHDPDRLARFQREAKALAALDHPNIVTVFSVEEAGGVHFLTMQLVEGEPLDRLIPESGLPLERFVAVATALADALATAHEKGIVHRDLKPANVMVTPDGRVKVLDFGLAKDLRAGDSIEATLTSTGHTQAGVVMGTPAYMSPEQVAGRPVDQRTDLFSLGVLLYEMASGARPFRGDSSAELASAILRDTPRPLGEIRTDLPTDLARLIRRCLEKDPRQRIQTARDIVNELRQLLPHLTSAGGSVAPVRAATGPGSGAARADEGFWVAVLPFRHRGADPALEALAEGLSEDVVTGLSRFSYLRVIARGSTARLTAEADVRAAGRELGARYVMEGSLRQAGATLRVAVQLVDATTGVHLWAETYTRPFHADAIFDLQDDLVSRIVATVADMNGVLCRSMSEIVFLKAGDELTPYEAVLRGFGYLARLHPDDHAAVRPALERAVRQAPGYADAWAMLSDVYADEFKQGFNETPGSLDRALEAARRAVAAAPASALAHHMLAQAHYFRRELPAFRIAAERAIALNPMDAFTAGFMGILIAYSGNWQRGCALAERAMQLNPHHPGWYRFAAFHNAYRQRDFHAALDLALAVNMPGYWATHAALAAVYGQLGEREAARGATRELLALRPDIAEVAREEFRKWFFEDDLLDLELDGLRKAGIEIPEKSDAVAAPGSVPSDRGGTDTAAIVSPSPRKTPDATVAIAVLSFADMSPDRDQAYLCEGMAEEIMSALVSIDGIRVASRTSAFRAQRDGSDLSAIARALSVAYVLEGSVRTAGTRLRVTAQLTDVTSSFHVWSERFDREAADVFAVQDEIAAGVVEAVRARLGPGHRAVQARSHAANLEAYRAYLMGRYLRHSRNDHHGAMQAFEEAVGLDPSHAPSWVGLAEGAVLAALYGAVAAAAASAKAKNALSRAEHLQGESADALAVEGLAAFVERRWRDGETAFRRALELEPDNVRALVPFGQILGIWGAHDEAQAMLARAREADPLAALPHAATGVGLLLAGRRDEAQGYFDQALTYEPENTLALWGSCMALVALGQFDAGVGAAARAAAVTQRAPFFVGLLGWALASAGRSLEAWRALEQLRAHPAASRASVPEAWVLAALGDRDAAFGRLQVAEAEYQAFLAFAGLPAFDPLRDDPRFTALLERLGLPAVRGRE